jgi:predicted nucleic acid-binding protein
VNRYALDTSVLLRWFSQIHDADSDRALALRQEQLSEKVKLTVLDLSVYELAHVLKEGQTFDQPRIDDALASLEFMHVDIVPYSLEITRKATQIALEHSISI